MLMTTNPTIHQSAGNSETPTQPYPPSWVDRFIDWVRRLPGPSWLFYLVLWLALFLMANAVKWLDGSEPLGTIKPFYTVGASDGVYYLALMHYLKGAASVALRAFRPALTVSEVGYNKLRYQLTTLPARGALLAGGIGGAIAALAVLSNPTVPNSYYHTSLLATAFGSADAILIFACFGACIYQTIHQLTMVSRIHATATRINLFQPDPLYAFSGLTARTAMGYLLLADTAVLIMYEFTLEADLMTLGIMAFMVALATVTFVLPLLGMHRRMVEEKTRLESEANQRLEATIAELHRRVDGGDFTDIMSEVNSAIESLEIELSLLAKISTWPWQPGTLRVAISPVLLPVAVWLIQRLLERVAGL
jgi:hypothetical protein